LVFCSVLSRSGLPTMAAFEISILDEIVASAGLVKAEPGEEDSSSMQPGTSSTSSLVQVSGVSPPSKRRRKTGASIVEAVSAVKGEPADESNPSCSGCGRIRNTSPAFLGDSGPCEWAYPDGRGMWCQDCHTVWRTCFQSQHPLRMFERWLRIPENLQAFHEHLLAYLTLLTDSVTLQVRRQDVTDRVDLVRRLSQLLGFPLEPAGLTVLDPAQPLEPAFDTRRLLTLATPEGIRFAKWQPVPAALGAIGLQPCPRSFFNLWHAWPGTSPEDRALLLPVLGPSATLLPAAGSGSSVVPAQSLAEASPFDGRLSLLCNAAKGLMAPFTTEEWCNLKEPKFKKALGEAATLKAEASNSGHERAFQAADTLTNGLCSTKEFAKLLRDHNKSKQLFGKLKELAVSADAVRTWLEEPLGMKPSTSFSLLALKAGFVQQLFLTSSLEKATQHLMDKGMPEIFRTTAATKVKGNNLFSPSLWLRSVFSDALQKILAEATPTDAAKVSEAAAAVHADLLAAQTILTSSLQLDAVAEFLKDVSCFLTVLAVGGGSESAGRTAAQVVEAASRVKGSSFAGLNTALATCSVWQQSLAAAAAVGQTSSQDFLGDEKFARAISILEDIRLPHVRETVVEADTSRTAIVDNAGLLTDGSALDSLAESLGSVVEALSLWSPVRAEAQANSVARWATDVLHAIESLHELQWLCLAGIVAHTGVARFDSVVASGSLAETLNTDLDLMPEEEPLLQFCEQTAGLLASLPNFVQAHLPLADLTRKLRQELPQNAAVRSSMVQMLTAFCSNRVVGESPEALVEDWRLKNQAGSAKQSALANLAEVLAHVHAVVHSAASSVAALPEEDVAVTLVFGSAGPEAGYLVASLVRALKLPEELPSWPLVVRTRELLAEAAHIILRKIGEALGTEHARFDQSEEAAADGWAVSAERLIAPADVAAKVAAKVFGKSGDKWPFEVVSDSAVVAEPFAIRGSTCVTSAGLGLPCKSDGREFEGDLGLDGVCESGPRPTRFDFRFDGNAPAQIAGESFDFNGRRASLQIASIMH
jgi:hypothetical protein